MTKAEIISFVQNNLKKVDKTNKYHDTVVEKAITLAFNQGYGDIFDEDPRLLDNYTRTYGAGGTPINITLNGTTGFYESTLPSPYVPFNDKHSGVRHVATVGVTDFKFFPILKREFELLPNTLTGELNANDPRGFYVVRGGTLEYFGVTVGVATAGCRMDLVIPFEEYAADDPVLIPFTKDIQLVTAVIEVMRTMPQVDLKDNNADIE
jgi:hypothetical protein